MYAQVHKEVWPGPAGTDQFFMGLGADFRMQFVFLTPDFMSNEQRGVCMRTLHSLRHLTVSGVCACVFLFVEHRVRCLEGQENLAWIMAFDFIVWSPPPIFIGEQSFFEKFKKGHKWLFPKKRVVIKCRYIGSKRGYTSFIEQNIIKIIIFEVKIVIFETKIAICVTNVNFWNKYIKYIE